MNEQGKQCSLNSDLGTLIYSRTWNRWTECSSPLAPNPPCLTPVIHIHSMANGPSWVCQGALCLISHSSSSTAWVLPFYHKDSAPQCRDSYSNLGIYWEGQVPAESPFLRVWQLEADEEKLPTCLPKSISSVKKKEKREEKVLYRLKTADLHLFN